MAEDPEGERLHSVEGDLGEGGRRWHLRAVVQEASLFNCKMGGGMGSVSGMLPIANNRNPGTESASLKQNFIFLTRQI